MSTTVMEAVRRGWISRKEHRPAVDPRVAKAVIGGFTTFIGIAGLVWGTIYLLLGVPSASFFPYGFSVASVVNALAYRRHGRASVFGGIEIVFILVIPIGLAMHLGGPVPSGAVGLWALLAPIGALLVLGADAAVAAFGSFVALTAVSVWVRDLPFTDARLPSSAVDLFLFMNIVGVALVAYWATRIFLSANHRLTVEQFRLREVEKAYVAQEVMLRQQERLAVLGKLSAGVAHELNNPAAAAGRATRYLGDVVGRLIDDGIGLLTFGMSPEGLAWVRDTTREVADEDPLDRGDREERIATWLEQGAVEDAWDLASDLAALGFDADSLDSAAERYRRRQVIAALRWIVDEQRAGKLLDEVRTSTGRISGIVGALKGYSHMDRAEAAPVDVDAGLDDTLVILQSKLTGIEVVRERGGDTPTIFGHPGELNQVWTNLIANAAEALGDSGTITLRTYPRGGGLVVEVEDDGPGIPGDLLDSVFDPFVTTKPPGEGTGLGLNLVHQIVVDRHGGTISVESEPGRTRFVVTLPAGEDP